jgi:phospholipid/cholesterol/gamma-HCH transport system substrate-binding protein
MQRNIVETILGAVVLLVAAAFLFFFYRSTDIAPATGYEIQARFDAIDGLEAGSPVRISGVKVGQILGFELDPESFRAIVHMTIDNSVKLPTDTSAAITSAGLLDGKYLSLQPGNEEEFLKSRDEITLTQSSVSLEQLLGRFIFSMSNKDSDKDEEPATPEKAPAPAPAPDEQATP